MTRDEDIFWRLGRNTRTGEPLKPPYDEARQAAAAIYDHLAFEIGLSTEAIRKVACVLLTLSVRRGASSARKSRGGKSR